MAKLIPVVEESSILGGGTQAILGEIAGMLENLMAGGESGQIDVRSLPLSPDELTRLRHMLGEGEANIELELNGTSRCRETAFPAVWWIEHRNADDKVIAELIEVARVPDILAYDDDEITDGIESLNLRLTPAAGKLEESNHE
ncbi:MAG TPA: hydrogenase expression/formation C-terminal domain-containing protein [Pseudomonadales bacterium]|nr:hydrogenase expression/formation C-terminal domain-containing protein [Pseudomonadales bacterium]